MNRLAAILLPVLFLAVPCAAQDAGFGTEAEAGFEGTWGKVDQPVLAVGGTASPDFAYREDSTERTLSLAATRFFGGVPDDGATPLALLPFVARRSSVSARVAVGARSSDSVGIGRGLEVTLESRFTADRSPWSGGLEGTWFLRPEFALHALLATEAWRETQGFSTVQTPGGSTSVGTSTLRRERTGGALGVVWRATPDASLELSGGYRETTDRYAATLPLTNPVAPTRREGERLGVALAGSLLALERRLHLESSAEYGATHGSEPSFHVLDRRISGAATFYPERCLGVGASVSYATSGSTTGPREERRAEATREVEWSASVRFFPRPRASVALRLSRTVTDAISPPDSESFRRLRATDDRASLTAALRF